MSDLTLFSYAPTAGTARKQDRATSRDAARRKRPAADQARTLAALVANGGSGSIDDVCAYFAAAGIARDRGPLSRRLTDLAQAGRIRDTGETVPGSRGRHVTRWEVVTDGR